jgi:hypothetical protein
VASCSVDGVDIAYWLVLNGLALIGEPIRMAGTPKRSRMLNVMDGASGQAATRTLGNSVRASETAAGRLNAQTSLP